MKATHSYRGVRMMSCAVAWLIVMTILRTGAFAAISYRIRIDAASNDWEEVVSLQHDVEHAAGGARAHGAIRVGKRVDKSSTLLLHHLCTGTPLPWVRIDVRQTDVDRVRFYSLRLRDVLVTAYEVTHDTAGVEPMEFVAFSFQDIVWTVIETAVSGQAVHASSTAWDQIAETCGIVDPDSDEDGVSDAYETQEGLRPLEDDADEDTDHDGLTNIQESWAGTGAGNPDSVFRVSGISYKGGGAGQGKSVRVTIDSVPGKTYDIVASHRLESPPTTLTTVVAKGTTTTIDLELPDRQLFVRGQVRGP